LAALAISMCLSKDLKTDALMVPVSTLRKPNVFKNNYLSFNKSLYCLEILSTVNTKISCLSFISFENIANLTV